MLYVNKDELKDNISWGNLRSVEWQNNTIHIVFTSNFVTTELTELSWRRPARSNFSTIENSGIILWFPLISVDRRNNSQLRGHSKGKASNFVLVSQSRKRGIDWFLQTLTFWKVKVTICCYM